jgi:LPXTG-motif cell wall-anchored protein
MKNRILSLLTALVLLLAMIIPASATFADELVSMPDLTKKGSLKLHMDVDGVALNSGSLKLYRVATVTQVKEDVFDFLLLDVLAAAGATLDTRDLYDGVQAQRLLDVSREALPEPLTAPIADGEAVFQDLDAGLYLVWQGAADACDGYDPIHPFLISVPRWQNGAYTMYVEADPKVPFHTEPTEPTEPPPPPPPHLPQTGQLNWPIPAMAIAGAVLLVLGWILLAGRKRAGHAE